MIQDWLPKVETMNDDLKVPKTETMVELFFVAADHEEGEEYILFLSTYSPLHYGNETLEEFLNSETRFVPALQSRRDAIAIINLDRLFYVREKDPVHEAIQQEITVHFTDGGIIKAGIPAIQPKFKSRSTDYLNSGKTFLSLIHEGRTIYVNRNRILKVT